MPSTVGLTVPVLQGTIRYVPWCFEKMPSLFFLKKLDFSLHHCPRKKLTMRTASRILSDLERPGIHAETSGEKGAPPSGSTNPVKGKENQPVQKIGMDKKVGEDTFRPPSLFKKHGYSKKKDSTSIKPSLFKSNTDNGASTATSISQNGSNTPSASQDLLLSTVLKRIERRWDNAMAKRTIYSVDDTEDFSHVSVEITTDNPEYAKATVKNPRYFHDGSLNRDILENYHVVGLDNEDDEASNLRRIIEDLFSSDLDNRDILDVDFRPPAPDELDEASVLKSSGTPSTEGDSPNIADEIENLLDRFLAQAKLALSCETVSATVGKCYGEIFEEDVPVQEVFTTVLESNKTMDRKARLEAFKRDFSFVDFQTVISRFRTRSEGGSLADSLAQTTISTVSDFAGHDESFNSENTSFENPATKTEKPSTKDTPSTYDEFDTNSIMSTNITEKEVNLVTAILSRFAKKRKVSLGTTIHLLAEDLNIQQRLSKKKVNFDEWISKSLSKEKNSTPVA